MRNRFPNAIDSALYSPKSPNNTKVTLHEPHGVSKNWQLDGLSNLVLKVTSNGTSKTAFLVPWREYTADQWILLTKGQ